MPQPAPQPELISYNALRILVGLIGIALPIALLLSARHPNIAFEPSISEFFYTDAREIMVSSLCAIGVFLIAYRGFAAEEGEWISDNVLSTLAGLFAIGIAYFPTAGDKVAAPVLEAVTLTQELLGIDSVRFLHLAFAGGFFAVLAGICWFKFARTRSPSRRKFYRGCAVVLIAVLAIIAVISLAGLGTNEAVRGARVVFWVETIGVWVFGLAWLVKGLPRDRSKDLPDAAEAMPRAQLVEVG